MDEQLSLIEESADTKPQLDLKLIANPRKADIALWGPLAYVSRETRERILALPFGQFKPIVAHLERSVAQQIKVKKFK